MHRASPNTALEPPHVELIGIGKRFEGTQALLDIDLAIRKGTIHALVGENGAGKSTLGKIVGGVVAPDAGTIRVHSAPVSFHSPRHALNHGITVIAQEISLVPMRTVLENVFLGSESHRAGFVSQRALRARFDELTKQVGFENVRPDNLVASLRLADQQKVEILRALAREADLIVMDEPTGALTAAEASKLFEIVGRLKASGTTIVYVSHRLHDVLSLADVVTILKDGRLVRTSTVASETPESLVSGMLGRSLDLTFPTKRLPDSNARVVLEVEELGRKNVVQDVSFSVRAGEIVGLTGLVGSGRSELARLIFGADTADRGTIRVDGAKVRMRSPREAVRRGIAMLPESRKEQALVMGRSVVENITLPHLRSVSYGTMFVSASKEQTRTEELFERIDIRTAHPTLPVSTLSGGNQQKVVFAKWLFGMPHVLIADEPTRGVDVGAKRAIYELIASLAGTGMAVIMISSEIEEVLGLAHRVLVMRTGRIIAEFGADCSEEEVMAATFGTVLPM